MKRLYRSRSNEMIGGVCGGLADYLDVDPTIVRLIFVLLLFGGFSGFWIYLVLWIITPLEPTGNSAPAEVVAKPASEEPKKVAASKPAASKKPATAKKGEETKK